MLTKKTLIVVAIIFGSITSQSQAQFYVSPEAEYFNADGSRDIDNIAFYGLSLGYQINDRVSLEGTVLTGDGEQEGNNNNVTAHRYRIDAIANFSENAIVPYIIGGVGESRFDLQGTSDEDNAFVTMGGGLKYAVMSNIRLKTEARAYYNVESRDDAEYGITAGIDAIFGK